MSFLSIYKQNAMHWYLFCERRCITTAGYFKCLNIKLVTVIMKAVDVRPICFRSLGTESNATVDSKGSLAQRPFFIQELFALCPTLVLNEGEGQAREDKPHSPASTSSTSFTRLPLSSSSSSTTSSPAPSSPSPVLRGTQLRDSDVLPVDQACSGALEDGCTGRARLQDPELNGGHEESGIAEGEASISYPKPAAQRKRYDRVATEGMEERIDVNSARM